MDNLIIIIGAGASALMAARELSNAGNKVVVLEAKNRVGGRIYTLNDEPFKSPVELGTEFIHGKLPLTLQLLDEAKISSTPVKGKMVRVKNGEWEKENGFVEGWNELFKKMKEIREDMSLANFLEKYFNHEKYVDLRKSVQGFAEGFDVADISQASVIALRNEWANEADKQYRVAGGYQKLVDYLAAACRKNGCEITTSCLVKEIHWKKGEVKVITADGRSFTGKKAIVTISLGLLQTEAIKFTPSLDEYFQAARQMGYGSVIKILLQFNKPFWDDYAKNIGFIFSEESIPTWWTQLPDEIPLLTGWLGGPKARALEHADEQNILQLAILSLCSIFFVNADELQQRITAWKVNNWSADKFSLGAYSYDTLASSSARKILKIPVEQTIFFAGEALYDGESPGTVEAALVSGKEVVERILSE